MKFICVAKIISICLQSQWVGGHGTAALHTEMAKKVSNSRPYSTMPTFLRRSLEHSDYYFQVGLLDYNNFNEIWFKTVIILRQSHEDLLLRNIVN